VSLPKSLAELVPSGYQRIGDIALLKIDPKLKAFQKEIGAVTKEILNVKSVFVIDGIGGAERKPKLRLIAGRGSKTIHKEYGLRFALDVKKIMWAKGNHRERARLAGLVRQGEIVADMFAGIGYWSIFIAKAKPKCKIYAIDINPVAIRYLKYNIKLNCVKNIIPILGDCRKVEIGQKVDRVILGWLFGTEQFLPKAITFLKPRGIVHYHFLTRDRSFENEIEKIKSIVENCGRKVRILYKGIVKSYGPKVWHGVMDLEISK
jgi:tRNA wybutosine-synthesizing protein 2